MSTLSPTYNQQKDAKQWRIQDFPDGGAPTLKMGVLNHYFAENCMKMKEIEPPGEGGAFLASLLRSVTAKKETARY